VPVDPEVSAIASAAALQFEGTLGCIVEETDSPIGDIIEVYRAIVALETDLTGLKALVAGREHELSPLVRGLLHHPWTAEQFTDAITGRKAAVNAMARFMQRYDLILTPTVAVGPFPIGQAGPGFIAGVPIEDDAWTPFLYPANLTGQPAASDPAGQMSNGLPVGLQIVGRRLEDRLLLTAAAAFERIQPRRLTRPPLSIWNFDGFQP
jgi:aspartyl-tRNA(Asn)/glutamyl-tRNA(Gln) amidotransferase subunit A